MKKVPKEDLQAPILQTLQQCHKWLLCDRYTHVKSSKCFLLFSVRKKPTFLRTR